MALDLPLLKIQIKLHTQLFVAVADTAAGGHGGHVQLAHGKGVQNGLRVLKGMLKVQKSHGL